MIRRHLWIAVLSVISACGGPEKGDSPSGSGMGGGGAPVMVGTGGVGGTAVTTGAGGASTAGQAGTGGRDQGSYDSRLAARKTVARSRQSDRAV